MCYSLSTAIMPTKEETVMGQMQTISRGNTTVHGTMTSGKRRKTTQDDPQLSVVLYNTEVVRVERDRITLNHGGYKTVTTKARMNQAANQYGLGYTVYQEKGEWFVHFRGSGASDRRFDGPTVEFALQN